MDTFNMLITDIVIFFFFSFTLRMKVICQIFPMASDLVFIFFFFAERRSLRCNFKGCVGYIFVCLFCMSKREHS